MNLKILTSKEFENEIKSLIREKYPISMLDAVLLYCEQKNIGSLAFPVVINRALIASPSIVDFIRGVINDAAV